MSKTVEERLARLEELAEIHKAAVLDQHVDMKSLGESFHRYATEVHTRIDEFTREFAAIDYKSKDAVKQISTTLNQALQRLNKTALAIQMMGEALKGQVIVTRPASREEIKRGACVPMRLIGRGEVAR